MGSRHRFDPDPGLASHDVPTKDRADSRKASPRSRTRRLMRAMVGLCAVAGLAFGVAVYLLRTDPDHWVKHQAFLRSHSAEQLEEIARGVEDQLDQLIAGDQTLPNRSSRAMKQAIESPSTDSTDSSVKSGGLGLATKGEDEEKDEDGIDASQRPALVDRKRIAIKMNEPVLKALEIELQAIRINAQVELFITDAQMRALVAARLNEWMADRGYVMPSSVRDPMATVDDDGLLLAFEVMTPYMNQVFSARFDIDLYPDGTATLQLRKLWAGRLRLPAHGLGSFLRSQSTNRPKLAQLADWLDKLHGLEFKPVLELKHRRRARLERLEVLANGVHTAVRVQDHLTYKQTNQALATVSEHEQ